MKKLGPFVVVSILVLAAFFSLDKTFVNNLSQKFYFSFCDSPIHYRVDNVDARFGISKQTFENDVVQSLSIWDKAEGKTLFVFDPKGDLSVNLTFDERQALDNQINKIQDQITTQKSTLTPELAQYQSESANFNAKVQAFKQEVNTWNAQGGAPPDQYQKLIQEQANLKAEADRLNQEARALNLSADQYNASINQYNQTVGAFNQALQLRPEEGLYDGLSNRIDIYFDTSQPELIHTLAHEFGHALGIDHNQNAKSIMYPYSTQYTTLTSDDLASLEEVCRQHSIFEGLQSRIKNIFNRIN